MEFSGRMEKLIEGSIEKARAGDPNSQEALRNVDVSWEEAEPVVKEESGKTQEEREVLIEEAGEKLKAYLGENPGKIHSPLWDISSLHERIWASMQ